MAQVSPPPSCCCLCHSPRCQLTLLAPLAPVLWCLYLLSAVNYLLCCRLLLSTGTIPLPLAVPLPLVTALPCVAPLLFGWLLHFPAPQTLSLVAPLPGVSASTIHYSSTFHRAPLVWLVVALPSTSTPILSQLRLVPWPPPLVDPLLVTAFGVVCRHYHRHIHPVWHHLPQSRRPPNITVSIVVAVLFCRQRGASFAVAIATGALTRVRCQRGVSPAVARPARPSPGHDPEEGASPQVDDVCVPGTPWELGQKASCVSQL